LPDAAIRKKVALIVAEFGPFNGPSEAAGGAVDERSRSAMARAGIGVEERQPFERPTCDVHLWCDGRRQV
jgi:hypothetical protein